LTADTANLGVCDVSKENAEKECEDSAENPFEGRLLLDDVLDLGVDDGFDVLFNVVVDMDESLALVIVGAPVAAGLGRHLTHRRVYDLARSGAEDEYFVGVDCGAGERPPVTGVEDARVLRVGDEGVTDVDDTGVGGVGLDRDGFFLVPVLADFYGSEDLERSRGADGNGRQGA
jgi:hypothetical protein